jgi:thioredoxin 1
MSIQKTETCENCTVVFNSTETATANATINATPTPTPITTPVSKPVFTLTYVVQNNCEYCELMKPTIATFQKAYPDVNVSTINISENSNVIAALGIRTTPTTIIYRDGTETARFVGVQNLGTLEGAIA